MKIDLNADLAEGYGQDFELLQRVSSANICCGIHAGNAVEIINALHWAKQYHVRIGAHPSFPDRENFGRSTMNLPANELKAHLLYQLGALQTLCKSLDLTIDYVKPHGALYNQAAQDPVLAELLVDTLLQFSPQIKLMGLSSSLLLQIAQTKGMQIISEVFADRRYLSNGMLVPRSHHLAVIQSDDEAIAQVIKMIREGKVTTIDNTEINVQADSICLHGDDEHALSFADKIRNALEKVGIKLANQP
ncbi:MAG: 5-oxoprolinase subunit PxpA [Pasteurellaceae bacterium]|nr:5-oxoprolinase subunit PxpA [Pasteurellaceae bacterium]